MIKVIAVSGKIGAGKSTFCDIMTRLIKERGLSVVRISYATPLKDIVSYVLKDDLKMFYTQEGKASAANSKVNAVTRRKYLTAVGNAFTDIDPLIFCKYADSGLDDIKRHNKIIVLIDDLRRFKELKFISEHYNHHIVRIPRSFNPCDDPEIANSPQECELDYLDNLVLSYSFTAIELWNTDPKVFEDNGYDSDRAKELVELNRKTNIKNIDSLLTTILTRMDRISKTAKKGKK
jgi:hypothetical protein